MLDRSIPPSVQSVPFVFRKPTVQHLSNGIPLHTIDATGVDAVRIDFVFGAGQWHQVQNLQALFTCRMLREGCRGYSASAFAERMDFYGAWLELSVAKNRTFVTLYTLRKFFDHTIALLHNMLLEPTFSEEQLDIIRKNNKAQFLINIQKGHVRALRTVRQNIFGCQHPCGMQAEATDYDNLHAQLLVDYYQRYYGSRNCAIYLSGCVDEGVVAQVERLFGTAEWGSGSPAVDEPYAITPSEEHITTIIQPNAVQSSICMGSLLMDVHDDDYLSMRVLTTVLGGYFGSRLMKNVREEKGYTYHIGADLVTNTSQVVFSIGCEALADKANEVIDEVRNEMYRLQHDLVSNAELQMVRNYMTGEICRNYEGSFALADAYIYLEHLDLPQSHLEQTLEAIRTTDAVRLQQLAKQYLDPDTLYIAVVKP